MTRGQAAVGWLTATVVTVLVATTATPAGAARGAAERWDPRIRAIAEEVAELRDLEFRRPVEALFLTDKEFRKRVTADEEELTKADKRDLRFGEAQLRALGLVAGEFDLFATVNEEAGSGVVAYYNPDNQRIVVRGKKLDTFAKVSVAHELTHALQDQHFDLAELDEKSAETSGAQEAMTALMEGDASRIELAFLETLDRSEQDRYWRELPEEDPAAGEDESQENVGDENSAALIGATFDAPYALGPAMVSVLDVEGGNDRVDRAFRRPPTTQLQILDPLSVLDRAPRGHLVPPKRPKGTRAAWPDDVPHDIGALDVFFLLSSRIPALDALAAADEWKAGAANAYRKDGDLCFDVVVRARDRAGAERLARGVRAWAAAMPPGSVTVAEDGLGFGVCDPGKGAPPPPSSVLDALNLAANRSELSWGFFDSGLDADETRCVVDAIVVTPEFAQVVAVQNAGEEPADADYEAVFAAGETAAEGCIGG